MDWNDISRATTLSLPDRLSVDIERLILDGKLEPGERLPPERELADHFGVSRVSIREALRELEPMAWDFVMNFARDNRLQVADACLLQDAPAEKPKP